MASKSMSNEFKTNRFRLEDFVAIALGIIAGWAIVQGQYFSINSIFSPWHHDDFSGLAESSTYTFRAARLFSSNSIVFLAPLGSIAYYLSFFAICLSYLTLAALLVQISFDMRLSGRFNFAFGFAGSVIWFAQSSAAQMIQYLGLITNGLSALLGFAAMLTLHVYLRSRHRPLLLVLFVFLCAGSAFSKEDMSLFLLWGILLNGVVISFERNTSAAVAKCIIPLLVVLIAYGASLSHDVVYGSAFLTGKSQAYDLSHPVRNIIANLGFYFACSRSTFILSLFWAAAGIIALVQFIRIRVFTPLLYGTLFVSGAYFALLAPYLILPRRFDFYAMNFLPLLSFGIIPFAYLILKKVTVRVALPSALMIALIVGYVFYKTDRVDREAGLAWLKMLRERSLKEIQETQRAADLGLATCDSVLVSGVSDEIGPFHAVSTSYFKNKLGLSTNWVMRVEPDTRLDTWRMARPHLASDWQYLKPDQIDERSFTCGLKFDPITSRAEITAPLELSSEDWISLGRTHHHLSVVPSFLCDRRESPEAHGMQLVLAKLASSQGMSLQNGRRGEACSVQRSQIAAGQLEVGTAYVIGNNLIASLLHHNREMKHYCRPIDGFYLCSVVAGKHGLDASAAKSLVPTYRVGSNVDFSQLSNDDGIFGEGWSGNNEHGGRWSTANEATLIFHPSELPSSGFTLHISAKGLVGDGLPAQTVEVTDRLGRVDEWSFAAGETRELSIAGDAVDQNGFLILKLKIPNATSPSQFGINDDQRRLGLFVYKLRLSRKTD